MGSTVQVCKFMFKWASMWLEMCYSSPLKLPTLYNHLFTQILMNAPETSVDVRTFVKTLKAATCVYATVV